MVVTSCVDLGCPQLQLMVPAGTGRKYKAERSTRLHDCGRYRLEQMPFMEFYQGLRERNWTSPWYKEDAAPWRVQFFQDSGRFMAPSYPGYRCDAAPGPAGTARFSGQQTSAVRVRNGWCKQRRSLAIAVRCGVSSACI